MLKKCGPRAMNRRVRANNPPQHGYFLRNAPYRQTMPMPNLLPAVLYSIVSYTRKTLGKHLPTSGATDGARRGGAGPSAAAAAVVGVNGGVGVWGAAVGARGGVGVWRGRLAWRWR